MTRALALALLLAGCSAPVPPAFPDCPAPVATPAGVPKHPTRAQTDALEIRVELWAESLLHRGNACADAVDARDAWIRTLK
ncbi:MAG TPA: hypothetical protein VL614_14825 [Acetobacteraceae bacterium]|nr:hypothetical protein [Acetobacteraceae bacterium]